MSINKIISNILLLITIFSISLIISSNSAYGYSENDDKNKASIQNIVNPGNLPFIHDDSIANATPGDHQYGTISNESGFMAFGKALEFSINTLIKLVGVMCLFGVTEGLIRLVVGHGNEEVYGTGIKMIMWSIIGLILSLTAHAIVTGSVQFLTGVGSLNL